MIAAARITRGPLRVARRLLRKATKPLRLMLITWQQAAAEQNIAYFEQARVDAAVMAKRETERLTKLSADRMAIERGLA